MSEDRFTCRLCHNSIRADWKDGHALAEIDRIRTLLVNRGREGAAKELAAVLYDQEDTSP